MSQRQSKALALAGLFSVITFLIAGCKDAQSPNGPTFPEVGIVTLTEQALPITTELPGRTSPLLIAEVRPQVNGIIQKRLFKEGADVKAGDVLYHIDPALYKATWESAKANLAKAQANLNTLKLKADRFRELLTINAVSKQDFDDAEAAYKQAQADVQASNAALDTARINLDYTRIAAPISGRIGISSVTPGALVTADQATVLTTIQQLDPMYVDVAQSSVDVLKIKRALDSGLLKRSGPHAAKVKLMLEDGTTYKREGKLAFSDVTVDQGTGTVTLRAIFPNPDDDLLPGMFVRAVLEEGVNEKGMLAPQQGVTRDARGNATALVLNAQNKVELRTISVGQAVGNQWPVLSGLKVGERLIVDGVQKIKPGDQAQPVAWPSRSTK